MKRSTLYLLLLALLPLLLVGSIALSRGKTTTTTTPLAEQDAHTEKLRQDAREAAATAKMLDDAHRDSEEKIEEIRRLSAQRSSAAKWARGETPTSQESRDAVGIKSN